jgi:hypothetical protein
MVTPCHTGGNIVSSEGEFHVFLGEHLDINSEDADD